MQLNRLKRRPLSSLTVEKGLFSLMKSLLPLCKAARLLCPHRMEGFPLSSLPSQGAGLVQHTIASTARLAQLQAELAVAEPAVCCIW